MTGKRQLRIIHVDTGRTLRGGQRQVLLLARGLGARGHAQLIVCPEESDLETEARAGGFPTLALPRRDPGHARGIRRLRRRLRPERFDLIHAHDGAGQTIGWLASMGIGIKRVASRRVTFLPARKLDYRLKYQHTAHAVIAVSEFVKKLVTGAGVDGAKVEVIPDGIAIPPELPGPEARQRSRVRWGFGDQDFIIGLLGAPSPEKGQDAGEQAFLLLAGSLPRARLIVAGEAPDRTRRTASTVETRLARDTIHRIGYQENLDDFFAGLDLFLMPSRAEGLGSSALLAMAHGLPVVATRVGGLPEAVLDGKTGWLVEPESPQALARAILEAASGRARLHEFGLNARRHAAKFSIEQMVSRTEALYRRLLEPVGAGGKNHPRS